jgi:hypothetical protein
LAWTRSEIGLSKKLLAELPPPQAGVPVWVVSRKDGLKKYI